LKKEDANSRAQWKSASRKLQPWIFTIQLALLTGKELFEIEGIMVKLIVSFWRQLILLFYKKMH